MIIRTVSQLPRTEVLNNNDLFHVSLDRGNSQYISKAITYGDLYSTLQSDVENNIASEYGLKTISGFPISLQTVDDNIQSILSGNTILSGEKTFIEPLSINSPSYSSTVNYSKNHYAVDAAFVADATAVTSNEYKSSMSADAAISCNGQYSDGTPLTLLFNSTDHIYTSTSAECNYNGNLFLYGWLADTGTVDTAAAWVALEGYFGPTLGWRMIQLQPWILGTRHSNMQYVGFNVSVAKNFKIRVSTGFELNFSNSTYQNRKNSLVRNVMNDGINITNAFIGTIFH